MPSFTKKAIAEAFFRLLDQKPLDKITVKDIVEECDITRRTFYYHYQDIYALVEDILRAETEKVVSQYCDPDTWEEGFLVASHFVLENRRAIFHLRNSVHRDEVDKYVDTIASEVMFGYIKKISKGIPAKEEDKRLICEFYKNALVGLVKTWLDSGMKYDPEQIIRRTGMLFDGNIKVSLERSAGENT